MNADLWREVQRVHQLVTAAPKESWRAIVDRECGDNQELRSEIERLLRAAPGVSDGFLEPPTITSPGGTGVETGTTLGDFEVEQELGRGASGVVYRARDRRLGRAVALKVLGVRLTTTQAEIDRFLREARAAAKLRHAGIVPVLEVGRHEEFHYFAMQLAENGDLARELERQASSADAASLLPRPGEPGHVRSVIELIAEAAEALHYAHDQGIVHRDIKPQNLLITADRRLCLADFGLAKDESQGAISRTGLLVGTPYYMSPEQAEARRAHVDERTDVFSLGVVLYEMLTLERPFQGDTAHEIISRIATLEPKPLRKTNRRIPRDLDLVCQKAMAKKRDDRYPSAGAFALDLRRILALEAVDATPPSVWRRVRSVTRRYRTTLAIAGGALMAIVATLFATGMLEKRAREARWEAQISRAIESTVWSAEDPVVMEALKARREIRDFGSPPSAALASVVAQLDARATSYRSRRVSEVRDLATEGQGGTLGDPRFRNYVTPVSVRKILEAVQEAGHELRLFPEDPGLQQLAAVETMFPKVNIELDDTALIPAPLRAQARAYAMPLDPYTDLLGEVVDLGPLPTQARRLAPGGWRFVVEVPNFGFAEYDRLLTFDVEPLALSVRVIRTETVRQGMAQIAAPQGGMRLDPKRPYYCCVTRDEVPLSPFLLDEAEVSNREYLAYLKETGRPAPALWTVAGFDGDWWNLPVQGHEDLWMDLPVVGPSCLEAREYCEYVGKRLASHYEFEFALRGPKLLKFPWGDGPPPEGLRLNVRGPQRVVNAELIDGYRASIENTVTVRAQGSRHEPFGLHNLFGNVEEWTWSSCVGSTGTRLQHSPRSSFYMGSGWYALADTADMTRHASADIGPEVSSFRIGFRCAKSVAPVPSHSK